jgi:dTDP-4-dehydrorhamnose 3,5-epimerase
LIFRETPLAGAFVIDLDVIADERGSFARTFDAAEFALHGLNADVEQCNISENKQLGTLRGMHYQVAPYAECKLVRCTNGAIFDVIVDLRDDSATFCDWFGIELSQSNGRMLYIPEGLAHGFLTLADGSDVHYQISRGYEPAAARGVRWDDPLFDIEWPIGTQVISERDREYPDYRP